jgi:beta-galactosidase
LSNCKQVELFLNGASLGKQAMKANSKLSWQVKYAPGTLSAKVFDAAGNVVATAKVETTGDATQIQLTPDRQTINADGQDVAVFTVSALDAQGRAVPVAQNKINFLLQGAGQVLGVGNGDPSCHEPDVYLQTLPMHTIAVNDWRWKTVQVRGGEALPEYATDFDDASWSTIKPKTDGDTGELVIRKANSTAVFRANFKLSQDELNNPGLRLRFASCDDEGWYFLNGKLIGESHDWQAQPGFDIKQFAHAGENVIAVGVRNNAGEGGLNPDVNVDVVGKAEATPWSRSLFNGLAQIIVQSTREAGEFKLTAASDGLAPASAAVQTRPCAARPAVP